VSDTEVQRVEDKLNSRPRKILGYRTPREVFFNASPLHFAVEWAMTISFSP
jgi:IS30 family transposase